jgi:hypothetical protein
VKIVRSRSSETVLRRGIVSVELAMFLPLYAALLTVLMTLSSVLVTRQQTTVKARHLAWVQQPRTGPQTAILDATSSAASGIGRILQGSQNPAAGLISADHEQQANIFTSTLNQLTTAHRTHYTLTDPWDHRVLRFEDRQQHPGLTLAQRSGTFGGLDKDTFSRFASILMAGAADAAKQEALIRQRQKVAENTVRQSVSEISNMIDAEQRRIRGLQDNLKTAQAKIPPDPIQIADLRRRIGESQKSVDSMRKQMAKLRTVTEALTMPGGMTSFAE